MKKAKFFIFHKLERFVLKRGKNENQQFPGDPPNIENLFGTYHLKTCQMTHFSIVNFWGTLFIENWKLHNLSDFKNIFT